MKHTTSHSQHVNPEQVRPEVAAGLPGASSALNKYLRKTVIDPDRLSILHLGRPPHLSQYRTPPWVFRMVLGYVL